RERDRETDRRERRVDDEHPAEEARERSHGDAVTERARDAGGHEVEAELRRERGEVDRPRARAQRRAAGEADDERRAERLRRAGELLEDAVAAERPRPVQRRAEQERQRDESGDG